MNPLESDPTRQAHHSLRGYSYQIWHSLLRWLELQTDQCLYLEGAEDIDVLGPSEAETIQVKDIGGSSTVTLRSSHITEAIDHFWQHCSSNPKLSITFRFLTTASRGHEKSNPFDGLKGLDIWDQCKYLGASVNILRNFLLTELPLASDLKNFIQNSTDEELRTKLILPIEWDTGNYSQPILEELVERKVVEHGDRVSNLSPHESKSAIGDLLKRVWEVVVQKENRGLTRYDFITLFETATMRLVSRQQFQEFERRQGPHRLSIGLTGINSEASFPGEWNSTSIFEPFNPPSLEKFVNRAELVADIKNTLNKHGLIVLTGSTGMGKSILSSQIAIACPGTWRKLDLRGYSPEEIRDRLIIACRFLEDNTEQTDCIIDDLNFDKQINLYENALSKFLSLARIRNGRVVITSHHALPTRITNAQNVSDESLIPVQYLNEEEIKGLAERHNCPDGSILNSWSRIVIAHTRGHPLLAHAEVRNLEFKNWPSPTSEDIFSNEEVKDVRHEFRGTLRDQLPEDARMLLYRLSVFSGRFNRRQALYLGARTPALKMPGDNFDMLIGPWIEPIDATYFRLSPLLTGTASEVFTEKERKNFHSAAASSYLKEKTVNSHDISEILLHGILGENPFPMMALVPNVLGVEEKHKRSIYEAIKWFGLVKIGSNEVLFPSMPMANHLLRALQFTILSEVGPIQVLKVARNWEQEINSHDTSRDIPGSYKRMMFQFLSDVILEFRVPFKIKEIATWVLNIISLLKSKDKFYPTHPEAETEFVNSLKPFDQLQLYVRTSIGRCKSPFDIVELLMVFEESRSEAADIVWKILDEEIDLSSSIADKFWLDEVKKTTPDWNRCLKLLDWVIEYAIRNKINALIAASVRAKSIIYKEYLIDHDKALQLLHEGEELVGFAHPFLLDYSARIFLFNKDHKKALQVLEKILDVYEEKNFSGRFVTYRDAVICADETGQWEKAAQFANKGRESLETPSTVAEIETSIENKVLAATFWAEYSFALWKSGKKETAIIEFGRLLDNFQNLPKFEDDIRTHQLYKKVSHGILWMQDSEMKGQSNYFEPKPGWFSDFNLYTDSEDQPKPKSHVWLLLSSLERDFEIGDTIFKQFDQLREEDLDPPAKMGLEALRIQHALRRGEFSSIVALFVYYSDCVKERGKSFEAISKAWNEELFLKQLTFTVLILLSSRGDHKLLPLKQWRGEILKHKTLSSSVLPWLDLMEEALAANKLSLVVTLKGENTVLERRILAALMLSATENLDLDTFYYANIILLCTNFTHSWKDDVEKAIEDLIVNKWKNIASTQRFALLSPNVSAPLITAACNDNSLRGIGKAAKVLIAADFGVSLKITQNTVEQLKLLTTL